MNRHLIALRFPLLLVVAMAATENMFPLFFDSANGAAYLFDTIGTLGIIFFVGWDARRGKEIFLVAAIRGCFIWLVLNVITVFILGVIELQSRDAIGMDIGIQAILVSFVLYLPIAAFVAVFGSFVAKWMK